MTMEFDLIKMKKKTEHEAAQKKENGNYEKMLLLRYESQAKPVPSLLQNVFQLKS